VLRGVHGARVAVSGFYENYPFFGLELSNTVVYPAIRSGARFYPHPTCGAWLRALRAGRYDYVVTAREGGGSPPRQAAWTRAAPGAIELAASAPGTRWRGELWSWQLFRLDRGPASMRAQPAPAADSGRSVTREHRLKPAPMRDRGGPTRLQRHHARSTWTRSGEARMVEGTATCQRHPKTDPLPASEN
jgi:hypothetical protein